MRRGLTLALGLVGIAAALILVVQRSAATALPAGDATAPASRLAERKALAPASLVTATKADQTAAHLSLPDGTFVRCLNGATGAPPLSQHWGTRPWSPIIEIERSDRGVDWYVHADGTRTTTEMKWRQDLGRYDAMTRIAVPMGEPPAIATKR